ncbi:MAG: S8 family serine peptidase [Haliscomenobacter sp.]|nr:S8 family serine peptidase [Haliscomenobacter sp.]MBK8655230.1 S8 family serine peptidase [Haliscomenobacter sp.]
MKRRLLPILLLLGLSCERGELLVTGASADSGAGSIATEAPTHVIQLSPSAIGLQPRSAAQPDRPHQVRQAALSMFARLGIRPAQGIQEVYTEAFTGFACEVSEEEAFLLQRQPEVLSVEDNRPFSLAQSLTSKGKAFTPSEQITPWGMSYIKGPARKSSRTAWILDTGIDQNHPDLNVDVARSRTFLPWYYYENGPDDQNGHGTHMAGIIGALDNGIGTVGVAAGTQVVSVKVLSRNGVGLLSTILKGMDYVLASASPGDVANLSLSGRASDIFDLSVKALADAGIRVVIAAGNNAKDIAGISPARAEGAHIYTVSAIDTRESLAGFSNFGKGIDCAEPGVDIPSTYRDGTYAYISGTSAAAPHLAGLLLLDDEISLAPVGFAHGDPDGDPDPILGRQ